MKKKLIFIPVGGLANRMRTIDAAIALCHQFQRPLDIIWFKDKALSCSWKSLFESLPFQDITIRDARPIDYLLFDRPRKKNMFIPWLFQQIIFRKCIYENTSYERAVRKQSFPELATKGAVYMASFSRLCPSDTHCSMFKPISQIQERIDITKKTFGENCIGVHIRRGDHLRSISESPLSLFIKRMDEEIINIPTTTFYVATDSETIKKELTEHYGKRILVLDRPANRLTDFGMQDAVLELYALASTKKILGSFNSTFSQLAAELGAISFDEISKTANKYQS